MSNSTVDQMCEKFRESYDLAEAGDARVPVDVLDALRKSNPDEADSYVEKAADVLNGEGTWVDPLEP
jgi:hypothetical protein